MKERREITVTFSYASINVSLGVSLEEVREGGNVIGATVLHHFKIDLCKAGSIIYRDPKGKQRRRKERRKERSRRKKKKKEGRKNKKKRFRIFLG